MKSLLLGGASFLGYHLSKILMADGNHVTILDEYNGAIDWPIKYYRMLDLQRHHLSEYTWIEGSPCAANIIKAAVFSNSISHIIFFPPNLKEDNPYKFLDKTASCLVEVLEILKSFTGIHFTLISSSSIYDSHNSVTNREFYSSKTPSALYSVLMQLMEDTALLYHMNNDVAVTVLRMTDVYGPFMDSDHVLPQAAELLLHHVDPKKQVMGLINKFNGPGGALHGDLSLLHVSGAGGAVYAAMKQRFTCDILNMGPRETITGTSLSGMMMNVSAKLKTPRHRSHKHTTTLTDNRQERILRTDNKNVNLEISSQRLSFSASTNLETGLTHYIKWFDYFRDILHPTGKQDVILTSYFTTKADPQRHRKLRCNHFEYMMDWYWSVMDNDLQAIIFHDGMNEKFMQKIRTKQIQFVPVTLSSHSTNDERFFAYLTYLKQNPHLQRVFMTDISDVKFQHNPFELMDILGDYLYIGSDIDLFPKIASMGWLTKRMATCFGVGSLEHRVVDHIKMLSHVYNAGVIGGSRHIVMEFLKKVTEILERTPSYSNCNMAVVNFVAQYYFRERLFTGFPLTSRFMMRQQSPKGVYIIHK